MANRHLALPAAFVLLLASFASAATYRTTNFVVDAPTAAMARKFGEAAEYYRQVKAREWLGQEMPNWQRPCPLRVEIAPDGPSGATTFDFNQNPIYQYMQIRGREDRLLNSVLPHEITHTVFAHYFRQPVPRWADEGGAVLSEDDIERQRHDQLCRQLLNAGKAHKLWHLFNLKDYPNDVMVVYAEGFSIVRFLVDQSDRQAFLKFVAHGMRHGWDNAVQAHYGYKNVNDLEAAWINSLRKPRASAAVASTNRGMNERNTAADLAGRSTLRSSAPPAQPDLGHPTVRGSSHAPSGSDEGYDLPRPSLPLPPPIPLPQIQPVRLGPPQLGPLPSRR